MFLRRAKVSKNYFLGCSTFPSCKHSIFMPRSVIEAQVLENCICTLCSERYGGVVRKIMIKFQRSQIPPYIPSLLGIDIVYFFQ